MAADVRRVSTGSGKTTCGYFFACDKQHLLRLDARRRHRLSTAARSVARATSGRSTRSTFTPPTPTASGLTRLTSFGVYTAEGTLSPDGKRDRVHVAQGRRSRPLHDERGRHEHPATHQHTRATTAARSSRPTASGSSIARTTRRTRPSWPSTARCSRSGWCGRTRWKSG